MASSLLTVSVVVWQHLTALFLLLLFFIDWFLQCCSDPMLHHTCTDLSSNWASTSSMQVGKCASFCRTCSLVKEACKYTLQVSLEIQPSGLRICMQINRDVHLGSIHAATQRPGVLAGTIQQMVPASSADLQTQLIKMSFVLKAFRDKWVQCLCILV